MFGSRHRRPSHLKLTPHISHGATSSMFVLYWSEGDHTAEGRVENDVMIIEVLIDRTPGSTHKRSRRIPPAGWVGGIGERIGWDVAACEIKDVDGIARPFQGIDPSSVPIESIAEGRRASILNATAPSAVLVHQGAARVGVQCHCVLRLEVDAFDDVDFAIVGPLVML